LQSLERNKTDVGSCKAPERREGGDTTRRFISAQRLARWDEEAKQSGKLYNASEETKSLSVLEKKSSGSGNANRS